jgi:hypothetical protein
MKMTELEFNPDSKSAYASTAFSSFTVYGYTKLLNVLFAKLLHALYRDQGVFAVSLHPGVVHTEIFSNSVSHERGGNTVLRTVFSLLSPLFWYIGKPASYGAATSLYLSLDNDSNLLETRGGEYFEDMHCLKSSPLSYNDAIAKEIWNLSINLCPSNSAAFNKTKQ